MGGIAHAHPPMTSHHGRAHTVAANNGKQTLRAAWSHHPERFVRGIPKPLPLPEAVWINPPCHNPQQERLLSKSQSPVSQKSLTGSGLRLRSFPLSYRAVPRCSSCDGCVPSWRCFVPATRCVRAAGGRSGLLRSSLPALSAGCSVAPVSLVPWLAVQLSHTIDVPPAQGAPPGESVAKRLDAFAVGASLRAMPLRGCARQAPRSSPVRSALRRGTLRCTPSPSGVSSVSVAVARFPRPTFPGVDRPRRGQIILPSPCAIVGGRRRGRRCRPRGIAARRRLPLRMRRRALPATTPAAPARCGLCVFVRLIRPLPWPGRCVLRGAGPASRVSTPIFGVRASGDRRRARS